MMVCLAMTIQENTIDDSKIELENSHRLHATVISIMTFICWLHNAAVSNYRHHESTNIFKEILPSYPIRLGITCLKPLGC